MTPPEILDAIAQAAPEDLAAVLAAVAARLAEQAHRTPAPEEPRPPEAPARYLTPMEAATIAALPLATPTERRRAVRRVYGWAATPGVRWASRPSRKCLRVHEAAFRRWLEARR